MSRTSPFNACLRRSDLSIGDAILTLFREPQRRNWQNYRAKKQRGREYQGVLFCQTLSGEPVKTTRVFLLLLAVFFCLPGLAQSNAHPDYAHQHKDAEKYQKQLIKERRRQEKEQAKVAKANRDRHH
jgi:hypothetical protein